MNNRSFRDIAITILALTALVGCARPITQPIDTDVNTVGTVGQVGVMPTGIVTGRVVDSRTKLGLSGVTITLMGAASAGNHSTTTNGSGEFILQNVPAAKQKLSLNMTGYTYLSANGDVVVDVIAGTTITTPDIQLTKGVDAVTNSFVASFQVKGNHPQRLAYDATHDYLYTVAQDSFRLGSISTPKQLWGIERLDTKGGFLNWFGASLNWFINEDEHIFQPMGMTCGSGGNLYLCDPVGVWSPSNPVKRYDLSGNMIMPNKSSSFFPGVGKPYDIKAMRDGFAIVNDSGNVMLFNSSGALTKQIPVSNSVSAVAVDGNDNLYVIDGGSQTAMIKKYALNPQTNAYEKVLFFGTQGRGASQFTNPTDLAVDGHNGDLYVVDSGNNRVVRFSSEGTYLSEFGGMGSAPSQFNHPTGIVLDKEGFVYVSDTNNNRVQKFNPSPLRQIGQSR